MTITEQAQLVAAFQKEVRFDEELKTTFLSYWVEKEYDKHDWICEAGQTEPYFYYVLDGVQVLYFLDNKGDKVVLGFSYQGDYSGSYESFLYQKPSPLFVESLLPSRMLAISYDNYHHLFELSHDFERWARKFSEGILFGRLQREIEIVNLTASERYLNFMRRCPDVLHQIPQKYLASYLNMKPETYSRLRRSVRY